MLERLRNRNRRRLLRQVARLLAELDVAAEQTRPRPSRAGRVSLGSTR